MATPGEETNDEQLEAPAGLRSALGKLAAAPVFIPKTVDEAVLKAARSRLRPKPCARRPRFSARLWATAAVATVLLAALPFFLMKRGPSNGHSTPWVRKDVNHDGRVDVLDALLVARQVDAGLTSRELDFNGDGVVDQQDAASIAAEAVRLDQGGRS